MSMNVISKEIISEIGKQIEPSSNSLDWKQLDVFKNICADMTSKELASIKVIETTKKIHELTSLCAQLPEGANKTDLVELIKTLVKS